MLTSSILDSFSGRLLVMFMDFHTKELPGKYKFETDLQVFTVSTRRYALTNTFRCVYFVDNCLDIR